MKLGLERLIGEAKLKSQLKGRRVGLVAHPASVAQCPTMQKPRELQHSLDALKAAKIPVTCAFGPQHGMRGEKQDNMIESDDFTDPKHGIPIFSLYGKTRRPSEKMLEHCDTFLFDLQDVGCRIYTFLTTLFYIMEDAARTGRAVWVLDRPNPAGRVMEGSKLDMKFASFVGAAPTVMRHGLTLGEAGEWYKNLRHLNLEYRVVKMQGYDPTKKPGFGWPLGERAWVNPSPNMPRLSTARMYAGTVLIEGTKLSEGRGTTRPLELMGAPGLDGDQWVKAILKTIKTSAILRPCFFEPTFQKHTKQLCAGFQIHVDHPGYQHAKFQPYRIVCAALKTLRQLKPDFDLWLSPPYEYETEKMPIDILSGDSFLREWVDDPSAKWADLERKLARDEAEWKKETREYFLY